MIKFYRIFGHHTHSPQPISQIQISFIVSANISCLFPIFFFLLGLFFLHFTPLLFIIKLRKPILNNFYACAFLPAFLRSVFIMILIVYKQFIIVYFHIFFSLFLSPLLSLSFDGVECGAVLNNIYSIEYRKCRECECFFVRFGFE